MHVLASWLEPERDTAGVRSACGAERYARLVDVKDRWDRDNVFRLEHNIEPSASVQ
jgi:hypothetical protein